MHPSSHRIQEILGALLQDLARLETQVERGDDPRRVEGRTVKMVRRMTAELERGFAALNDEQRRLDAVKADAQATFRRAQAMFDHLPVPAVIIGADGEILDANVPAARLLNVSLRHLRGKQFPAFLNGDRDTFTRRLARPLAIGGSETLEIQLRPRERAVQRVLATALPDTAPEIRVLLLAPVGVRDGHDHPTAA